MKPSEVIPLLKSISDRSRILLINALAKKSQYVEELSERLNLASSTISFHLKKLEEAGLVESRKDQYYVVYSLKRNLLDQNLLEMILDDDLENKEQEHRIKKYRQKVLHTFFKYGKLVKIPVQRKKRRIILEEIAKNFLMGKRYSEREVNIIIADYHDDFCTIRREFICEGIMERNHGEYWLKELN